MKAWFFCVAGLLTLTACFNTKLITSEPPGARVYVDGEYVGDTPYTLKARNSWIWHRRDVEIRKEGYDRYRFEASNKEEFGPENIWLTFPFIMFAGGYDPETHIDLYPSIPHMATGDSINGVAVERLIPKTPAQKRAIAESLYEEGAITKEEYEAELAWIAEEEAALLANPSTPSNQQVPEK